MYTQWEWWVCSEYVDSWKKKFRLARAVQRSCDCVFLLLMRRS